MNLRDYLHFNRITNKKFAQMIQHSVSYIVMIKTGRKIPSIRMARMIQIATNGAVTVDELRGASLTQSNEVKSYEKKN